MICTKTYKVLHQFILVGFIGVVVPTILFVFTLLSVIIKIFELLYMFIISPWISAYSVVDNGKMMKKWKLMFVSKFFSIALYPVIIQIYVLFINRTLSFWDKNDDGLLHTFTKIFILIGATLSINGATVITAAFFGDNLSVREGLSQLSQISQLKTAAMGAGAIALGVGAKAVKGGLAVARGGAKAIRGGKNLYKNFDNVKSGAASAFNTFKQNVQNIKGLKGDKFKGTLFKESGKRLFSGLKDTFSAPFKEANIKHAQSGERASGMLDKLNQMKENLKQ
ncbi:Mbov_0396 family ICE element transmembrane protein [Mycoplasmopsis gallinacea]|uniref:Uncharacterized protein n=1 Tax=Mycoplasmopsis gallinacea TaxID=29556 RepID=A0A6H0V3R3_9BACT|nr:hypothetical protein [Mycoplasmopsis gallinacea]QIW62339.1 hypothetical protein GOQ20_02805 [Mycoplasmopsis gallinacea]